MKPIAHEGGKRWMVMIPARMSATGKRQAKYFKVKSRAEEACKNLRHEWTEFGRSGVSNEERQYISLARIELNGDLSVLPEVLRHWKLTGPGAIQKTALQDAIPRYLEFRATLDLNRRTQYDTKSALRLFNVYHIGWYVDKFTTSEIREYINKRAPGSSRKTVYRHLNLFFRWCKDEKLVIVNPLDAIQSPADKAKEVEVYSPEDFEKLLRTADATDPDLIPFLALSGFGMVRSGELMSQYADKPVLQWENVIWDRGLVHVPEAVAKQTRRAVGNRREFPICDALAHWLQPFKDRKGRVVDCHEDELRARFSAVRKTAGVAAIDNGLRKSAISYYIAAHPEVGVTLAAKYAGNSESISRRYYLTWLTEERGRAWFGIRRSHADTP